jgi:hypothetical protein
MSKLVHWGKADLELRELLYIYYAAGIEPPFSIVVSLTFTAGILFSGSPAK